jgi:hypothetical protein
MLDRGNHFYLVQFQDQEQEMSEQQQQHKDVCVTSESIKLELKGEHGRANGWTREKKGLQESGKIRQQISLWRSTVEME